MIWRFCTRTIGNWLRRRLAADNERIIERLKETADDVACYRQPAATLKSPSVSPDGSGPVWGKEAPGSNQRHRRGKISMGIRLRWAILCSFGRQTLAGIFTLVRDHPSIVGPRL